MTKRELRALLTDVDDDTEIEIDFCYNENGDFSRGIICDIINDDGDDCVALDCCIIPQ